MLLNHLEYEQNSFLINNYTYSNAPTYGRIGKGDYNFNTVSISYTMGRSRVFFDRIVLDGGIRFGFVPAGVLAVMIESDEYSASTIYSTEVGVRKAFRNDTYTRLFTFQAINFHLGLSFLAF